MLNFILPALIGAFATIAAAFISLQNKSIRRKVISFRNKPCVRFIEPDESFKELLGIVQEISMYTVNSFELRTRFNTILEQNPTIIIKKLTIMVRKKENENQADLDTLETIISLWKSLVEKKRIKKLTIIAYNHDPDHYYTILGNRIVFCGQVFFDETKPTGTTVDFKPLVFSDDTDIGQQVIKNYKSHFDNVVSYYKERFTLYDSSKK